MSKRRWFQFHLSTAVVLMFVAGGLMWVNSSYSEVVTTNATERREVSIQSALELVWRHRNNVDIDKYEFLRARPYGWPCVFAEHRELVVLDVSRWKKVTGSFDSFVMLNSKNLVFDVAAAASVLLAAGWTLEWRIRRKAAKP